MSERIAEELSEYISSARERDLPAEVVDKTTLHILDTVAASVSGGALEAGARGRAYAEGRPPAPEATVWATPLERTVPHAALANAMGAHADETDDSHAPSRTHPGCSIVPTAVAVAEARGRSGSALVRAVALGYDSCGRVPPALWPRLIDRGAERVRSTHAAGGLFGSTAAAGSLVGLDAAQCRSLLSYATQRLAGTRAYFREGNHVEKAYVFAGMPAFDGTTLAELVECGWTGVADAFSGFPNFFDLGADPDPEALTDGLGSRYEVMRTKFKKHPGGSPMQSPVEALLRLIDEHGVTDEATRRLEVRLAPERYDTVIDRPMPDINVGYLMEVALRDGQLSFAAAHDLDRFAAWQQRGKDPRVELVSDPSMGSAHSAYVTVETTAGEQLTCHVPAIPGSQDNPMSAEDVERKARGLLAPRLGEERARGLTEAIRGLDGLADVRELRKWLRT